MTNKQNFVVNLESTKLKVKQSVMDQNLALCMNLPENNSLFANEWQRNMQYVQDLQENSKLKQKLVA